MFSRVDLCFQEVISVLKTDLIACVRDLKSCRTPRIGYMNLLLKMRLRIIWAWLC